MLCSGVSESLFFAGGGGGRPYLEVGARERHRIDLLCTIKSQTGGPNGGGGVHGVNGGHGRRRPHSYATGYVPN